ncbi:30 kDa heat shock protein [Penicillium argentinense]|uniref:30 kDa heat shock protein n=1 Tax=Penicillium argentinense TaxID=1131581 RepID=A0A9W9EPY3_9EURO|nr:30 kDa heat shock protein [Penicillium argentinense]KAJ5085644.1 30 kDa heat shock protein [Penicillium argentinense]
MAFFQCHSDFAPLFRLLDDYETHCSRPTPSSSFTPSFDVREGSDAYYLDGELPGVDQSNIDIEFSDPQTLVVKGRTARNYQSQNHTSVAEASSKQESRSSRQWRQPTVQDEDEAESDSDNSYTDVESAKSSTIAQSANQSQPQFHFWASERSIGEFQRTFNFLTRVDQDNVRASLNNGVLSIVVPKEAAPKLKKIRIL